MTKHFWLAPVAALVVGCAGAGQAEAPRPADATAAVVPLATAPTVGASVYVTVSVATLWSSPSAPRPVDAPALANPVRIPAWLAAMSYAQELDLAQRNLIQTQALYGERLVVKQVGVHWLRVVAPGQRDYRNGGWGGYPGWVPRLQVTTTKPATTAKVATVVTRLARLRTLAGDPSLRISYGTILPVIAAGPTRTTIATPTGGRLTVADDTIVIRARGVAALPLTTSSVMTSARLFRGVQYLWGGRSGYAVDCSGFTGLVYSAHGVALPRDADDQARVGMHVAFGAKRVADLLFFWRGSTIGHVAFFAGNGSMLQAAHTGTVVGTASVSSGGSLAAVRRFVG